MDDENEDRAAVLSAMYQDDGDHPTRSTTRIADASVGRSRKIRVGIVEYEVPTPEYVQSLERLLQRQAVELAEQRQLITRLTAAVSQARHSYRSNAHALDAIRGELDKKIGRE